MARNKPASAYAALAYLLCAIVIMAIVFTHIRNLQNKVVDQINQTNCQEDDPCWNPATMGDHNGYICYLWPDGEIHAYHDTIDAVGTRTDCP